MTNEQLDGVVVRMEDLRKLRYCARGVRAFFERHGLDYNRFLSDGIDARELLTATNEDGMALAAVEVAHGRQQ